MSVVLDCLALVFLVVTMCRLGFTECLHCVFYAVRRENSLIRKYIRLMHGAMLILVLWRSRRRCFPFREVANLTAEISAKG